MRPHWWQCRALTYSFCRRDARLVNAGADNKPHFANPASAQRAAQALGTTPEDLAEIVFAPPPVNQFMVKMRRSSEHSGSPSSSAEGSPDKQPKSATAGFVESLEGLAVGFYQEAFSAVIRFINR